MSKNDSRLYSYYFDRFGLKLYDFNDKERAMRNYVVYMLNRTQRLFEYKGLPDTIPQRMLEFMLQVNGFACVAKHNGKLYAFWGGLGGEPDEYYRPTKCVVSNPALKFSDTFEIDKDCIIVRNDSALYGLVPLFTRYATALVENDISFRMASINTRVEFLLSAPDDRTKEAGVKFLKDVEDGKLGVIGENAFLDGIKAQEVGRSMRTFTDLIEYQQYLKASWFNEIGLNANYNMKREKLSTTESQMNNDALLPLVEDMLESRRQCIEKVNAMFGTEISVDFASSWEKLVDEIEAESNQLDGEEMNQDGVSAESNNSVRDSESSESDGNDVSGVEAGSDSESDATEETSDEGQAEVEAADAGVEVNVEVDVNVGEESEESNQLDEKEEGDEDDGNRSVGDNESE